MTPTRQLVLTTTLLFFGIGCGDQQAKPTLSQLLVVGVADNDAVIHVRGAQQIAFRLPTNPSTGYAWTLVDSKDGMLQQIGEERFEPGADASPGSSGFTWKNVRARASGEADVSLELRAPSGEGPAVQTLRVKIVAKDILAVSPDEIPLGFTYAAAQVGDQSTGGIQASQQALFEGCAHLPGKINLCAQGTCTPVKSQGQCGSCWAFAATAVVENTIRRTDWITRDLSEQYIVSCNDGPAYCDGSMYFGDGLDYYKSTYSSSNHELAPGAVYEEDFPYSAGNYNNSHIKTSCNGPHQHHERIDGWEQLGGIFGAGDACVKMMLDAGYLLTTFADATNWSSYSGGIRTGSNPAIANHVVTIVGYDDGQGVWIVRNSWGSNWGETADGTPRTPDTGGYIRIKYGGDAVAHDVAWVTYSPNESARASLITAVTNPQ